MSNKDNMDTQIISMDLFRIIDTKNAESSADNLPAAIILNDMTVYPSVRYRGQDATITSWPAWEYGSALTIANSRFEAIDE